MTAKQIPHLMGRFVEHQVAFSDLSTEDAQWASLNPMAAIALCVAAIANRPKEAIKAVVEALLEAVGTVTVSATTAKFSAKAKFVVNTKKNAPVKISGTGSNFDEWFLSGDGKIEEPIGEQTLHYAKLLKRSVDAPILAELGGNDRAESTLTEMYSLMEKQKNGESGVLLNNGYANIFYIKDSAGVLRAVLVRWSDDGWGVGALSVEYPNAWSAGHQVFSRNSLVSSDTQVPA